MNYVHYLPGGGLGDVFREAYFHNVMGILKRFKIENPTSTLKLLLMSHNPQSADLFLGQSWIDELKLLPFKAEPIGNWPACYTDYKDEFTGYTELRFNIADHRSNYRSDLTIHRPRKHAIRMIPAVGCAWTPQLSAEEWEVVRTYSGKVLMHLYAGNFHRSVSDDNREALLEALPDAVPIGADYHRDGHEPEDGLSFSPRVLAEIVRRARGVVGTESSVYYMASMLGVPTCLLYRDGNAFAKWHHHGDATWDWFFGVKNPQSRYVRLPLSETDIQGVQKWAQ